MSGHLLAIAWKERPRAAMIEAQRAEVSVERGIAGDFRGASPDRQVTIVFKADWDAACAALGEERPWTLRRANLLIEGLDNPRAAGARLQVGSAVVEITGETEPCSRMDAQWQGLTAALTPGWRGGLTARVITGGTLGVGDAVAWLARA